MTIYVSELPKSCGCCPCCNNEYGLCQIDNNIQLDDYKHFCVVAKNRHEDCPLKLLKDHDRAVKQHAYKKGYNDMRIQYELGDYTKQVRKEVCEEIAKKMGGKLVRMQPDGEFGTRLAIDWYDVNRVLDQIQGETK